MSSPEQLAYGIAARAHAGTIDKIGVAYIEHPAAVAWFVKELPGYAALDPQSQADAVAAAWLHDTIEDTGETGASLAHAGISEQAVATVVALTRTKAVAPDDYYAKIKGLPIALLVKTADIAHNLLPERVAQLGEPKRTKLAIKYTHALEVLGVDRSVITALQDGRSRIDLHTHSNRSDGTDSPAELVARAKAAALTVVALTDHDTTVGWAEATAAAAEHGIELVRGLEISVEDGGQGLHLLAYEPDPDDQDLQEMLARSIEARDSRIPLMVKKISVLVPDLQLEDVLKIAGTAVLGRPHLAEALVNIGAAADRQSAFAQYLSPGYPTYLETWSPPLVDAIRVVRAAGGVAVIAHPWGRSSHLTRDRFRELEAVGLQGIEVDHVEHDEEARRELRQIASDLELIATGSSDYHGDWKPNRLGCNTTAEREYLRLKDLWTGSRPPATAGARAPATTPS